MKMLRVGVIMGGRGSEREVSLSSGRTICDHLDTTRYTIVPIFQKVDGSLYLLPWSFLYRGKISDFEQRLAHEATPILFDELAEHVDFIYSALHGRYGEDGTLQGFLEILGIPYLGSKVYASALGMDKHVQKKLLAAAGVSVPRGTFIPGHEIQHMVAHEQAHLERISEYPFPLIVKPQAEGSSFGISILHDATDLAAAIEKAATVDEHRLQGVIIEEYIQGMEFCCVTMWDHKTNTMIALEPTETVCEAGTGLHDYEQKYMPGRSTKFTPARCSQEQRELLKKVTLHVSDILGFRTISRTDGFLTPEGSVVITDPNSMTGMSPSSFIFRQAAEHGMSHTAFINHLIEAELDQYGITQHFFSTESTMTTPTKKRVGVLLGGRSNEREISLDSGRNIIYKLAPNKYDPIALFVSESLELYRIDQSHLVRNSTKEIARDLTPDMKVSWSSLKKLVDFVFIGLHGDIGENGAVQGTLEMLDIPYNGSPVLTSALCNDKHNTATFLAAEGFAVPQQALVTKDDWRKEQDTLVEKIMNTISTARYIVKPHDEGCSVMVNLATTKQELSDAISELFMQGKTAALVEEYITGMELSGGVVGNEEPQALPPSFTRSEGTVLSIEEKFLPGAGENLTPAPLPPEALQVVQDTLCSAYKALGCKGYARIDCFYQTAQESLTGAERVIILEVNTLPGLTPATCIFHQAAEIGIHPMDFIDLIVELGIQEYNRRGIVAATDTNSHRDATSIPMNPPALENA